MYKAKTKTLISFVHIFKNRISKEAVQIALKRLGEERFDKIY